VARLRRQRPAILRSPLVLLIAAAGVAAWYLQSRETPPSGLPTIAVLPLANLSGDPEQEYFSDGITEDIITALTRFPGLRVLGRNTTFAHKGRDIDTQELGRRLGVRYLLEGASGAPAIGSGSVSSWWRPPRRSLFEQNATTGTPSDLFAIRMT
jgi:hypothetical protein